MPPMTTPDPRAEHDALLQRLADARRTVTGLEQMIAGLENIHPELNGTPTKPAAPKTTTAPVAGTPTGDTTPREGTAKDHILAVLAAAPRTWMTSTDIADKAKASGWDTASAEPEKVAYRALSELVKTSGVATKTEGRSRLYRAK